MPECSRCRGVEFWILGTGQYRCKTCRLTRHPERFYWHLSRLSGYWKGKLLEYFCLGVPAYRLRFHIPLSQKGIQRWYRVLRVWIYQGAVQHIAELSGIIEMDETMFGGRRPGKRGWGAEGKVIVFGIYRRDGQVLTFPVSSRSRDTLMPLVTTHTKPGSPYYTDDYHAYTSLSIHGDHVVITKEKGRPKGRSHINSIEGFWSYAKHWFYQYRGIPKAHFPLYLKEVEWRFNNRHYNLIPLLKKMVKTTLPEKHLVQLWV